MRVPCGHFLTFCPVSHSLFLSLSLSLSFLHILSRSQSIYLSLDVFSLLHTQVGTYNPIANKDQIKEVTFNTDRVKYWLSCGAQPSDRVSWLFGRLGLLPAAPVRQSVQDAVPKALREGAKK